MRWEQFKNRLSKEAKEEQVDVDVDAIWSAIEPQVDALNAQQPRRRRFLLWFCLGGLLIMGSGWLGNQLLMEGSQVVAIDEKQAEHWSDSGSAERNAMEGSAGTANAIGEVGKNIDQNAVSDVVENSINIGDARVGGENETGAIAEVVMETKQNIGAKNPITSTDQVEGNEDQQDQSSPKITKQIEHNLTPKQPLTNARQKPAAGINLVTSVIENNNPTSTSTPSLQKTTTLIANKTTKTDNAVTSSNTQLTLLPLLPFSLTTETPIYPIQETYSATFPDQEDQADKETKTRSPLQFSVEVLGGFSYINRSLSTKDATVNNLLNIRQTYESPLEAHHYGLAFGLQHQSGFRLSLGLQQTAMAERYQFDDTQINIDSVMGIQVYRINLAGDTVPIMGMLPRTTTTIYNKDIYNTYRLFDIPILLSYQYPFGKWQTGLEAGVLLNLSLKTEGIIPDENFGDIDIKTQQSNLFKSKLGISYQFGVSISRTLFDRFELRLTPTLRYFPTNFSLDSYGLSQKYVLLGGNLGLRYNF